MVHRKNIPPGFVQYGIGSGRGVTGWVVDPVSGCHIWHANRTKAGYAIITVERSGRKTSVPVHRLRYEAEVGPIPQGMDLDHYICSNGQGGCCNPHHCRPASHRENVLRGDTPMSHGLAQTHCVQGHLFTEESTRIRKGGKRQCKICEKIRGLARRTGTNRERYLTRRRERRQETEPIP